MWGVENGNHKDVAASSEGRISRVWRFWAALWTGLILALAYLPSALAEGEFQPSLAGVVQGPTPWAEYQAEEYYDGYLVYGANKYNCLIYALGLNPNDFDLVARGKLSSPSKGGKFYEVVQSGYNDNCPAWVSIPFYEGWLRQAGVTPGTGTYPQYLWAFEIYEGDYEQAKQDAITIRDGGSIDEGGGGDAGGSVKPEGQLTYTLDASGNNSIKDGYFFQTNEGNKTPMVLSGLGIDKCDVTVPQNLANAIKANYDANYNIFISFIPINGGNAKGYLYVRAYKDNGTTTIDTSYGYPLVRFNNDSTLEYYLLVGGNAVSVCNMGDSSLEVTYTQSSINTLQSVAANGTYNFGGIDNRGGYYLAMYTDGTSSGGGGGGSEDPDEPSPDPWPDPEPDPVEPTPPRLPEPGDPVVPDPPDPTTPDPDPVIPDPDTPIEPVEPTPPVIEPGDTYTVDIQGILDAMDEHCIHIQTCLNTNFSNLQGYIGQLAVNCTNVVTSTIYNGDMAIVTAIANARDFIVENLLQGLYDGLVAVTSNQADILDYFEDFAAWLDQKLDFQFPDSYDDTSVVYWLKRLYYKQGTGTVSRPEDPVTDPFGIGEWLRNLANLLIQALEGLAPGLVGDLLSTIDLLKLKFPFSLPWDIMTILGAFVASPEAPNVEFPCYAYTASGLSQVGTYDIDLDAYSNVMEGVRFVGYLGFMAYTLSLMPKWAETMCEVVGC